MDEMIRTEIGVTSSLLSSLPPPLLLTYLEACFSSNVARTAGEVLFAVVAVVVAVAVVVVIAVVAAAVVVVVALKELIQAWLPRLADRLNDV